MKLFNLALTGLVALAVASPLNITSVATSRHENYGNVTYVHHHERNIKGNFC